MLVNKDETREQNESNFAMKLKSLNRKTEPFGEHLFNISSLKKRQIGSRYTYTNKVWVNMKHEDEIKIIVHKLYGILKIKIYFLEC